MEKRETALLLVGLGNPGSSYAKTRHNAGFMVVESWAQRKMLSFHKEKTMNGQLANGQIEGKHVYVLKPETYMNKSGVSVKKALSTLNIPVEGMLIVHDDLEVDFGKIKLKPFGSHGGHNGVRDIQAILGNNRYFPRLRIGIGQSDREDVSSYVLEPFSAQEEEKLPPLMNLASSVIDAWILGGTSLAQQILTSETKKNDSYTGEKTNEST